MSSLKFIMAGKRGGRKQVHREPVTQIFTNRRDASARRQQRMHSVQPRNTTLVTIRNFGAANLEMVKEWLLDEAAKINYQLTIVEWTFDPPSRTIELRVATAADVSRIKQICATTPFRGQTLEIREMAPIRTLTNEMVTQLEELIVTKYDAQRRSLNLSGTHLNWNAIPTCRALCTAMRRKCTGCIELNLDSNEIVSLAGFRDLANCCPTIIVLTLTQNRIASWLQLQAISSLRLKSIAIGGNPMMIGLPSHTVIQEYFPGLMVLDNEEIAPPMKFGLPPYIFCDTLPPILNSYLSTPTVQNFATTLVKAVYDVFDQPKRDAAALRSMYAEGSFFSVSLSKSVSNLNGWKSHDRNLDKKSRAFEVNQRIEESKRLKNIANTNLAKGREDVANAIADLPATTTALDKIVCDAFEVQGISSTAVVFINLYGSMTTQNCECTFDRCMMVKPGLPTEIISDHIHLTSFSGNNVALNAAPPVDRLVERLMLETHLNKPYAEQALSNNGWDYDRAIAVFRELQSAGKIPPEVFS